MGRLFAFLRCVLLKLRIVQAMKVFHLITGLKQGGAEGILYRLAVLSRGHIDHVIVSMTDEGDYGPRLRELGVTVHALGLPRGRLTVSGLYRLWSLMREAKPDAVQTWMYAADLTGGLVARLRGVRPICWGVHNSNFNSCGKTAKLAGRLCAWVSGWLPSVIVSCSEHAAHVHAKLGYSGGEIRDHPQWLRCFEIFSAARRTRHFA